MISHTQKLEVFRRVVRGFSVAAAAKSVGLTPDQARNAIAKLCVLIKLDNDLTLMRTHPEKYEAALAQVAIGAEHELRPGLRRQLVALLRLRSDKELTPTYLANATASELLAAGITPTALAEIHEWLVKYGTRLKQAPLVSDEDLRTVTRAVGVLEAFGFCPTSIKEHLQGMKVNTSAEIKTCGVTDFRDWAPCK